MSVEDDQWWITGFSGQNDDFMKPNPNVMVVVGSVELSEDMYNALRETDSTYDNPTDKQNHNKYLIFDEENYKVWVCWYKGVI